MSDAIVRLKVESQEYDQKLKRAAEGLQRYADECRKVGGTLEVVEKDTLEYIKAIGKMETVNKSAQGSIEEMTKAYQEFARIYKQMSDEEKASPTGKILSQSLGELKNRIIDSKQELADINKELGITSKTGSETNGIISTLTSSFGISTKQLAGFGAAIGATKMALDVAKDAFFATQSGIDEWGRTVKTSESLYDSFLLSLNNSDISGFLSRIDDIVTAARSAYDAMSDLEVYSVFNQRNSAKSKAAYQKALDEYKLNPTAKNKEALAKANQQVLAELQQGRDRSERAYQAELRNVANKLSKDQSIQNQFIEILSSGNIDKLEGLKGGYKTGSGLNAGAQYYFGNRVYDGRIQDRATGKWSTMSKEDRADFNLARALSQITTEELKKLQGLGAQSVGYEEQMYRHDRMYNRMAGNNPSVTKTTPTSITIDLSKIGFDTNRAGLAGTQGVDTMPSVWAMLGETGANSAIGSMASELQDEIAAQIGLVDELRQKWIDTKGEVSEGYLAQLIGAEGVLRQLKEEGSVSTGDGRKPFDYGKDISNQWKLNKKGQLVQKKDKEDKNTDKTIVGEIGKITSGVSGIFSGIEQMGIKIPEEMKGIINGIQGVMTILTSINTILGVIEGMQTVGLIPFFARGGIVPHAASGMMVPGNDHSDRTPVLVSSGELILNSAQQNALANELQGAGIQNLRLRTELSGRNIIVCIENDLKARGKGQLATFK